MEETTLLMPSVPTPRACIRTINKPDYEIEQETKRLPRSIPYSVLDDKIIWLDLWTNERSLTFADEMIASNKLFIFDTAVNCTDFLDLSSFQTNYSIILSGIYALNIKVIDQLLLHSSVNQICLILPESCYGNIPDPLNFNLKMNVIYNNDPVIVMYWLCTDYSNFKTFVQHNNELRMATSDVSNGDFQCNRSVASYMRSENIFTNNIHSATNDIYFQPISTTNQIRENKSNRTTDNIFSNNNYARRQNNKQFSAKNKSSVTRVRSRSYEKIKLIDLPLPSTSQDSTDVHARKELEQINENVILLNRIVDEFQIAELTRNDCWYEQIRDQTLQLMIRSAELTNVISSDMKNMACGIMQNIQQVLDKLDLKVSSLE